MEDYPWLQHYPPGIDWHRSIAPKILPTILDETARTFPHRPALDFLGSRTRPDTKKPALNLKLGAGLSNGGGEGS